MTCRIHVIVPFFCDCGAEDGSAVEQNRVSCKCLKQLPVDEVEKMFKLEMANHDMEQTVTIPRKGALRPSPSGSATSRMYGVKVAKTSLRAESMSSLQSFRKSSKSTPWFDSLLGVLRQYFEAWKRENCFLLSKVFYFVIILFFYFFFFQRKHY